MKKTSKRIGQEGELAAVALINQGLEAKLEPNTDSGAHNAGDVAWTDKTPFWAKEWLKTHRIEIKSEKTIRLPAYLDQVRSQFNSAQGWVLLVQVPEYLELKGNYVAVVPLEQYLLEQKMLYEKS